MSICSSSLRALPRSNVPPVRTLLPFLYHTTTIQQWRPATRPIARRNISSERPYLNGVPFEEGTFGTSEIDGPPRSTMTSGERAAFQKLYRRFNAQGRTKSNHTHYAEIDQIADEYWEDDDEDPARAMDELFNEALAGTSLASLTKKPGTAAETPTDGKSSAPQSMAQSKKREATAEAAQLTSLRIAERQRVDTLLQNAQTDHQLWQILQQEVLEPVRKLDLDRSTEELKVKQKNDIQKLLADPRILFKNYPHHLITALLTLRTTFPASPLPLAFLPTIKSLGRSAYALGATTTLYKHLIRYVWLQRSSYAQIDQLLIDMNNGAIEFDAEILQVLDAVIKEHDMALSSKLGREMQMVYQMEQFLEGIKKIRQWRSIISQRLEAQNAQKGESTAKWIMGKVLNGRRMLGV